MEKYGLRVLVTMSMLVEEKAVSELEAVKNVEAEYNSGMLMGYLKDSEYYDGIDTDVEWHENDKYGIRVLVKFSTSIEVESSSKEKAVSDTKEMYYSGKIMEGLKDSEYYDGMDVDVEY